MELIQSTWSISGRIVRMERVLMGRLRVHLLGEGTFDLVINGTHEDYSHAQYILRRMLGGEELAERLGGMVRTELVEALRMTAGMRRFVQPWGTQVTEVRP